MLNYLWAGMMAAGLLWAAVCGNLDAVTGGILDSAKEAVSLCITMLGIMPFWCGILKIGEESGLTADMTRRMKPVIRFLFPDLPEDHPAADHIAANMIANILGLGWAATPAGLAAMKDLEALEEERRAECAERSAGTKRVEGAKRKADTEQAARRRHGRKKHAVPRGVASNEMCTFLIINISSLQLIPINMIAYRSQYGSANPTAIVGPALMATAASTLAGVAFCKVMDKGWGNHLK